MIYITGYKFHATLNRFVNIRKQYGLPLDENDTLIVLGHFNIENFLVDMNLELDKIERTIPYTILGLSGSYGSYFGKPEIYQDVELYGGTAKRIRNNVFQLQDCSAYQIEGKDIFVFNGGVTKSDPGYARGLKVLEEHNYSFDYVLSNFALMSSLVYIKRNIRNIDLSDTFELDRQLINTEFKQYIFAQGPPLCPLVKLVNDKTVFELQ